MSTPREPSPELRTLARAGAIGDIHAEDVRLAAALEHLSAAGLDAILAVGDVVDGPGDPRRCVELLEAAGVEAVSGNHDRWYLERSRRDGDIVAAYLETLPATRRYETAGGPLLLCHGLGENDMRRLTPDDYGYALETNDELQELLATRSARYVINGHTHRKMVKHFAGRGPPGPAASADNNVAGVTVINAGTLLGDHDPGFALVDFTAGEVSFFEVDGDGAIRLLEIVELSIP